MQCVKKDILGIEKPGDYLLLEAKGRASIEIHAEIQKWSGNK